MSYQMTDHHQPPLNVISLSSFTIIMCSNIGWDTQFIALAGLPIFEQSGADSCLAAF